MRRIDWWLDHLNRFRPVPASNRHVTVAFIGDAPQRDIEPIANSLNDCLAGQRAFELAPRGVETLPSRHRQRTIVLAFEPSEEFSSLADRVRDTLLDSPARSLMLDRPERAPRPHVTVARRKRSAGRVRIDLSTSPVVEGAARCRSVDLMRSTLTGDGPIYTPLRSWGLCNESEC